MSDSKDELKWYSPRCEPFRLAGFGWYEQEQCFRRLPAAPAGSLPESVDALANCTAGGQVHFQTDSRRIAVRVQLDGVANMNHMPATGQCGFDCYVGPPGRLCYVNTTKFDHSKDSYESEFFSLREREMRNVVINFPLYIGVDDVQIGIEVGAKVKGPPAYASPLRFVVYGTSITQGGCASSPGRAYTNILSRRINVEFINLGFSGSGRGEPEVAEVIATVPRPGCFVLDYEANCGSIELLRETFPRFIRILRDAHPKVPILAVSKIRYAIEVVDPAAVKAREEKKQLQHAFVKEMQEKGDLLVFFTDGSDLLGDDFDECAVDGAHPTDLGFMRMANCLEPVMREMLSRFPT